MQVIIRKAGEQDLRSLLDMYDELYRILIGEYGFPFEFSREENRGALTVQLRSKLVNILVAELNGEVIGFVHASISRLDRWLSRGDLKAIGRIDDMCAAASGGAGPPVSCSKAPRRGSGQRKWIWSRAIFSIKTPNQGASTRKTAISLCP
jgi:hypothetical protein